WKQTECHERSDAGHDTVHPAFFARTLTVFTAEQVDGADRSRTPAEPAEGERSKRADACVAGIGAGEAHGGGRACYAHGRNHCPSGPGSTHRPGTTPPPHASTRTGPATPTGSPGTCRAGSGPTPTERKS